MTLKGHCLCGKSTVSIDANPKAQIACHCTDCQRTSGAPHSSNVLVPEKDVTFSGPVKEYVATAASGNPVTRTFCSNCGGALAHNSKAFGDSMAIQTGNFDEAHSWPFEAELFVKDRFKGLAPIKDAKQVETA